MGNNPNLHVIYASYSDALGVRANKTLQRTLSSEPFAKIFSIQTGAQGWTANNDLVEFAGYRGSFRNITVGGGVTGFGLDLGVIDDPFKGRAEANSKLIRDKTWDWFTNDFFTRLSKDAGLLFITTRWHVDDALGRLLQRFGDRVRVQRYPALAEQDEDHWMSVPQLTPHGWGWKHVRRLKGAPLFPEHKPLSVLQEARKVLTEAHWQSLYQQNPSIMGGGELPVDKLRVLPDFDRSKIMATVRYWDKGGGTGENASFTAGVLMHKLSDGTFVIEDIFRGRWSTGEREQRIKEVTEDDQSRYPNYCVWIEQEPGSGGKESAENTLRNLPGWRCYADRVTGSKQTRAQPFAAQVQAGNVWLIAGRWVQPFLDECEQWPFGQYNDQVDACGGAFNKLTKSQYDTSYSWV